MRLCLQMIVKNEAAILPRCLESVAPWVSTWAITDTGSTDGTQDIVNEFFKSRHIRGRLSEVPFTNFSETRNAALDQARGLDFDYQLLLDADHELVVEDPVWLGGLDQVVYLLAQRVNGYSYRNTRLLRRGAKAHYVGVTHESLVVGEGRIAALDEAWIRDHSDGANRKGKALRDARLLEKELARDPGNSRACFYLAQSYRDAGDYEKAAFLYRRRASMPGWEEEGWHAAVECARALRKIGKDDEFVHQALAAYARRPARAEPLHDLAEYYIAEGQHAAAMIFINRGLSIPHPSREELAPVDHGVYDYKLRKAEAICSYYRGSREFRDAGHDTLEAMSLDSSIPKEHRNEARRNLYWFLSDIDQLLPSWQTRRLSFEPPAGYHQMSPSVTRLGNRMVLAERTVSYWVTEQGYEATAGLSAPIRTRNFLLDIDPDTMQDTLRCEILPPPDWPEPKHHVQGFEDMRLFEYDGSLMSISTVVDQNAEGTAEMWSAVISSSGQMSGCFHLFSKPARHEKNWMPVVSAARVYYVYLCDPTTIVDALGCHVIRHKSPIAADHFRGSTQLVPFDLREGRGWLAVVHSITKLNRHPCNYSRFVWFDDHFRLRKISRGFKLPNDTPHEWLKGYQLAFGLCWHPDDERLVLSYQTCDAKAWIATFSWVQVPPLLREVGD